jgi:hypothetical protein
VISPWTIYWIMQLDAIGSAIGGVSFFSAAGAALLFALGGMNRHFATSYPMLDSAKREESNAVVQFKYGRRIATVAVLAVLVNAFLPDSKTAAAVVLIPAIANNETVQKEAGELYQLAKDGLRELVKPEKENSK